MRRVARLLEALAVGTGFAALLASVAWSLGGFNPLQRFPLPYPVEFYLGLSPLGVWRTLVALLLLGPTLLAFRKRGREAAGLTALAAGVLIPAAYPYTNLDWTRLLKDFDLSHGGHPGVGTVLSAALPFLYAYAYHLLSSARNARRHYGEKGIPEGEVRDAARAVTGLGLLAAAGGVAASLFLALGLRLGAEGLPGPWSRSGLAAPVVAAALLTAAIVLTLRDHHRGGAEADGDEAALASQ